MVRPTLDRKRYLNVVYFVESSRSHTVRINLRLARLGVGAMILLATWSLASVGWIIALKTDTAQIKQRLQKALTAVFDYQIKDDHVFEKAYPPGNTDAYYSEAAQLASNNPLTEKKPSKPPIEAPSPPVKVIAVEPVAQQDAPAKPVEAPTASKGTETAAPPHLVEISNIQVAKSKGDNKIILNFKMNNRNSSKAEGYIWSIASFAGDGNKSTFVAAPDHTHLDANTGDVTAFKTAYHFSIQRYKNKSFDFKMPGSSPKIAKLSIHFVDLDGTASESVDVPTDTLKD